MAMNKTGHIEDFRIVTHPALLDRGRRRATGGRVKKPWICHYIFQRD